jgi:phage tail protein X
VSRFIEHITRAGQRWDTLAWQYYGDALGYERIVAANPHIPIVPTLPGGVKVLIPVIEEPAVLTGEELPPWKR